MTTIDQFRASLRNEAARQNLGIALSQHEAEWIADDREATGVYYRRWLEERAQSAFVSPQSPEAVAGSNPYASRSAVIPGRISGFTCSLIAALVIPISIASIALAIVGVVLSTTAIRKLPTGTVGRGLCIAALVLGYASFGLTIIYGLGALSL